MQRADIMRAAHRARLREAALKPAVVKELPPVTEKKSQSRVNPPELLTLVDYKGREEDRLKMIYGIVRGKRPLTEDEQKEITKLLKSQNGEDVATKRPDYDLKDFESEFGQ